MAAPRKSLKREQDKVESLAQFTWLQLSEVFGLRKKRRPPCYLFLSPQSKGSLNRRSKEEKDFVHIQQSLGGGACLSNPPLAYVSDSSQVPEEVSHLFVLSHQKKKPPKESLPEVSLNSMILHECFGRFGHELILGLGEKTKRSRQTNIRQPEDLWSLSHCEGYCLGEALAQKYFDSKLSMSRLKKLMVSDWYSLSSSRRCLTEIYKLSGLKSKKFKFS